MAPGDAVATQLVCDPEEYVSCPCTDHERYSCDCTPNETGTACSSCNAVMVQIDVDTGREVPR